MSLLSADLRLHDRFTLVERIGAGGMSEVWRATDEVLGRTVAVKALAAPLASDPALRRATWREARAAAQLTHPNVTRVYDYGEATVPGGGVVGYLVMELVTGQSLAHRVAAGALPWLQAVPVVRQVAAALAAAHRIGVIHRDVKPGNVMLTPTGVKVLDFGIAAVAGWAETDPGRLAGTPTYAAPERLDVAAPAAPAGDVYSLGVLCFETLTGRPPAVLRDWSEAMAAHRAGNGPPRPEVPGLPEELGRLCQACLAADPARRPSAEQVATTLAGAAGAGTPPVGTGGPGLAVATADPTAPLSARYAVGSAPPPPPEGRAGVPEAVLDRPEPPARRGGRLLFAGVATALVVLVAGVVLILAALRPDDPGGAGQASVSPPPPSGTAGPPSGTAGPADPAAAVAGEFEAALSRAFAAGEISRRALDDLRDKLDDVREAADEDDVDERGEELREEAEDLQEEIGDLREDGEISESTADDLVDLVDSLLFE